MGDLVMFPLLKPGTRGTIHVWAHEDGSFEIGQESESGSSWGSFETFATAVEAVAGAYRLNREVYGNACAVYVSPAVSRQLPRTDQSTRVRGEF